MLIYRSNLAARGEPKPYIAPVDDDGFPSVYIRPRRRPSPRVRPPSAIRRPQRYERTTSQALDLLPRIQSALSLYGLTPTEFGREALGDPNLLGQLAGGRRLRSVTRARIVAYLDRLDREA
ncbi:hypothetical protein LL251_02145 [Sphingobium naphthae]|nr:hypothetical protein [Sphingobium naphthae]